MQEKLKYVQVATKQLHQLVAVPDALMERLHKEVRLVKQPKSSFLEQENDNYYDGHLWYLVRGVACSATYDELQDKERPLLLWKKGDIFFQPASFYEEKDLQESICLWDDSVLLSLPYHRLKILLADYPEFQPLLLRLYGLYRHRLAKGRIVQSYSAAARISHLLNEYPGIDYTVKQELLADYLDINRATYNQLYKKVKTGTS